MVVVTFFVGRDGSSAGDPERAGGEPVGRRLGVACADAAHRAV